MSDGAVDEVLRELVRRGLPEAEVLTKRGRSRRLALELGSEVSAFSQERAWAVRASSRRGSFFTAGAGEPAWGEAGGNLGEAGDPGGAGGRSGSTGRHRPDAQAHPDPGDLAASHGFWPEPAGRPFRLPDPEAAPGWTQPSDFETPLIGESEGLRLLAGLARELEQELPGSRLLRATLEDGSSEGELANSRGLRVAFRRRLATLHLEVAGPGRPGASAALYLADREARRFHPKALARRLADRLSVAASGSPPRQGAAAGVAAGAGGRRGELLLAPPVAVALLAGLLPLLVGPGAAARMLALRDRRGKIGSERLTLIDNGRLAGGALECPVDGEGVPCREAVLVEEGVFRQPLLAWWQVNGAAPGAASGCCRRPGWRDLPAPGATHLYVRPDPRLAVAALLGGVARGHYLIDATGPARFAAAGDSFALPVCGFAVEAGRATAPVAGAWLCGTAAALFQGIAAVARDLSFFPLDGMLGSPTLLVTGLELRGAP
ncbi:MAG TPA: metallopeptidase TldD-related protein [Thermoanaerobaculia bacterium]|nr:metallopeptidase TldD-related protein [Thermoanaerobaculia bacterium]